MTKRPMGWAEEAVLREERQKWEKGSKPGRGYCLFQPVSRTYENVSLGSKD
jgi:hypothetical protein